MRSEEEVELVLELVRARWNDCEIARKTGIPRGTVRGWRIGRTPNFSRQLANCAVCSGNAEALPLPAYPYLLGLYLGVGGLLLLQALAVPVSTAQAPAGSGPNPVEVRYAAASPVEDGPPGESQSPGRSRSRSSLLGQAQGRT